MKVPEGIVYEDGLVPVVAQDRSSGDVLMVAFANAEAVDLTATTGLAHFWSRSRKRLWRKGEESGNQLRVERVVADCDRDTLLYVVEPSGPACHTGSRSCFGEASATRAGVLGELQRVIEARRDEPAEDSYTARLLTAGLDACLKKVGEESTEVVLAAKGESRERLAEEVADLLYHLLVTLAVRGATLDDALAVLERRRGR